MFTSPALMGWPLTQSSSVAGDMTKALHPARLNKARLIQLPFQVPLPPESHSINSKISNN